MSAYYDVRVGSMETATPIRQEMVEKDHPMCVVDEETGKCFRLEGVWCGEPLSDADLQEMVIKYFAEGEHSAISMELTDNGRHGDGIWLTFRPTARKRQEADHPLLEIRFTPPQAAVLGEALLAVSRLRGAQRGSNQ